MLKLTIEDDEGKTTVIPVIRDEMTIGRQEGNTIRLTERNVSRRHARLLRQNGVVYVEDLASFTGVRLNGARIGAVTPIREGDELVIGDYKIVLKSDRAVDRNADGVDAATAGAGAVVTPAASSAVPRARGTRTATPAMGSRTTPAAAATAVTAPPAPRPSDNNGPALPRNSAPEPLEAQPTIPVRTLGDMGPKVDGAPAPARLVVLSTELAGMEFMLGRASVVIGRTDENDVQLNHRSISRHHAKVVRDGDRYTIVDLQSANGVRVNGDDYERIELNPGDIVELGHVKMRFVGPFELYVFDPAAAAKLGERRVPSKIVFTVAGAVLSAVLLIILQRVASRPKAVAEVAPGAPAASTATAVAATAETPPPSTTPSAAPAAAGSAPAAAGSPLAAAALPPTTVVPPGQSGQMPMDPFAKIARDTQNEDWGAALTTIRQLNAGGPTRAPLNAADRARLLELFRKAETERKGSAAFSKFDDASTAKDYGGAIDWYDAIPGDSIYKKRASSRYQEARTLFVSEHLLAAEKFRTQGRCVETRREADQVVKVDPSNQLVRELVKLCKPQAGGTLMAAAQPRTPRARAGGPASPKESALARGEMPATAAPRSGRDATHAEATAAAAAPAEPAADPDFLLKQAREAWLHQQCGSAIDIARRALKAKPSLTDAYQIITVCSCSLRDADGASRAYGKLDDKSRTLARSLCQKNGISLGGE
ncbi:MAG TPA: FHA domain-containing protein [Polyangia bacterium]|nr:FHA domain-containing protein [Polyangia bacterium]